MAGVLQPDRFEAEVRPLPMNPLLEHVEGDRPRRGLLSRRADSAVVGPSLPYPLGLQEPLEGTGQGHDPARGFGLARLVVARRKHDPMLEVNLGPFEVANLLRARRPVGGQRERQGILALQLREQEGEFAGRGDANRVPWNRLLVAGCGPMDLPAAK